MILSGLKLPAASPPRQTFSGECARCFGSRGQGFQGSSEILEKFKTIISDANTSSLEPLTP